MFSALSLNEFFESTLYRLYSVIISSFSMCFKSNMLFIRLGYSLQLYRLLFKMNGAYSETWRQLPTTAVRENCCSTTQVTLVLCRRWRPSRNRIFLRSKLGYQFLTDFDSQNRCLVYALGDPMDHCCVHFAFADLTLSGKLNSENRMSACK